jgi:hypothetical protein
VPANIAKRLGVAIARAETAASESSKKAKRLNHSAEGLLKKAEKAVGKAGRGKHPKLSTECAADLANAIRDGETLVGSTGLGTK